MLQLLRARDDPAVPEVHPSSRRQIDIALAGGVEHRANQERVSQHVLIGDSPNGGIVRPLDDQRSKHRITASTALFGLGEKVRKQRVAQPQPLPGNIRDRKIFPGFAGRRAVVTHVRGEGSYLGPAYVEFRGGLRLQKIRHSVEPRNVMTPESGSFSNELTQDPSPDTSERQEIQSILVYLRKNTHIRYSYRYWPWG